MEDGSRPLPPFQKMLNQCVTGACRITPTIGQSSARIAVRQSELSRQVAVDFQPDADFDERGGCPGHGFVPFLGHYHRRFSAYPGGLQIQEIKTIAFVYGPASPFHADVSARLARIPLPRRQAPMTGPHGSQPSSSGLRLVGHPSGKHSQADGTWQLLSLDHGLSTVKTPQSLLGC